MSVIWIILNAKALFYPVKCKRYTPNIPQLHNRRTISLESRSKFSITIVLNSSLILGLLVAACCKYYEKNGAGRESDSID